MISLVLALDGFPGYGRTAYDDTSFRTLLRTFLTKSIRSVSPGQSSPCTAIRRSLDIPAGGELVDANMVEPREPTPMDIDRFLSIVSYVHSTHNYGGLGSEVNFLLVHADLSHRSSRVHPHRACETGMTKKGQLRL